MELEGYLWALDTDPGHRTFNLLELCAVFLALKYFMPVLAGCHVLVQSDNTSCVFYLNHQGSTNPAGLYSLLTRS